VNPQDAPSLLPGRRYQDRAVSRLGRIIRSLAVSGVTTVLSLTILGLLIRFDVTSPAKANVISTVAGIGPSFALNRRWAWRGKGRGHLGREVAPFWAYSLLSLVLSTIAVARAAAWADSIGASPELRTVVVLVANVVTFGSLWIGQFLLLDRLLFRHHRADRADRPAALAHSVGVELDGHPFGHVRGDAFGEERLEQRVVAIDEVVVGVGKVGHDDEVEVAAVDADVVAEAIVADLGDRGRQAAQPFGDGGDVGGRGVGLPAEHHGVADHRSSSPRRVSSSSSSSAIRIFGAT
jgi:putative flippase GtrA